MRTRVRNIALCSAVFFLLIVFPASAYQTARITNDSAEDLRPDTDGRYVAWMRHDGQDYEIMLYDAVTEKTTQITDNAVDDTGPAVSNGRVLFFHEGGGLYLYENGTSRPILSGVPHGDIEGSYVTYTLGEQNSAEVYLLNLETGEKSQITDNRTRDYAFKVLGGRVFFHHYTSTDRWDFSHFPYAYVIGTGEKLPFSDLWLYDDSFADCGGEWAAYRAFFEHDEGVGLYNRKSRGDRAIVRSGLADMAVSTDGRQVAWSQGSYGDSDLRLYDIASDESIYLTDTPGPEMYIQAENNAVTWTADDDIFLATAWDLSPGDYPDVPREGRFVSTHPFYEEITNLSRAGFISGFSDGLFHPSDPIRRAQYAKIIVNVLGLHDNEWDKWNSPSFRDVPLPSTQNAPRYPYDYVEEARAAGIVQGKAQGVFAPWDDISRVQLALMVARAGKDFLIPAGPDDSPFRDLGALSEEARRAIAVCYQNGIINGQSPTTFNPYGRATRGQAAKMTWRLCTKRP